VPSDRQTAGVLQQKADLKDQFDLTCHIFVNAHPEAHLEGMMAVIRSYRDFINQNVEQAGPLAPSTFVSWMESAERRPEEYPEPWGAKIVSLFDSLVIKAVREEGVQPATVAQALDEWAEQTSAEVKAVHGLSADFFDAAENRGDGR
jgi:hypothetical protein